MKKEVERFENRRREFHSDRGIGSNNVDNIHHRQLDVEASFYTAFCPTGCNGITATGLDVRNTIYTADGYRIIAVDPSVIPLGSIVKVSLENGDSFTAKAEDTGGAIKNHKIDILVETRQEAYELGRQSASVEIINEGGR